MKSTRLLSAVRKVLADLRSPSAGETLVVGLSGGPDSVALLDVLVTLGSTQGFRVVAAHLDHALRPDSAEDASFCAEICGRLGADLQTARDDVGARARGTGAGIEEAGREARYRFLRAVREAERAVGIAVAHTRDDQAETALMRLLRGSGSVGLGAMKARNGDVLRPLLGVSRGEVLDHLEARGLPWKEDPTNADLSFLRNRVRHELIPYLEARFNPEVRAALARSAALLADEAEHLAVQARELLGRVARVEAPGELVLDRAGLAQAPRALARGALRAALESAGGLRGVTADHVEGILRLAASPSPSGRRLPLPGGREARFRFGQVHVGTRTSPAEPFAYALAVPGAVDLPGGARLSARPARGPAVSKERMAIVPWRDERDLTVRNRRPGDRVRLGDRDVSLRRFLMARRVPADLREGLAVVAAGRDVLWVPGQAAEAARGPSGRYVCLEMEGA